MKSLSNRWLVCVGVVMGLAVLLLLAAGPRVGARASPDVAPAGAVSASRMLNASAVVTIDPTLRKVGLVVPGTTVEDAGFLWSAYQGLLRAESDLGVVGTVYTSTGSADYEPNLQRCVNDGNQLCLSVSWLMGDATRNVALANPATSFAIVDMTWDSYPSNLRGMAFAEDEAGYLAGTLAGLMTQSNIVGAVGGMEEVPAVVRFVEGYRHGAECANPNVAVLISYTTSFADPEQGAGVAQGMIAQGADVIFGPAGGTGVGAVLTATQSGVWGIGVDTDFYVNVFGNGTVPGSDKLLSSALKRVDNAVFQTIADAGSGTFTPGTLFYHLADEGVGLAPFHETDPLVPQSVRNVLAWVRQGIINSAIHTYGPCPTLLKVGLVVPGTTVEDAGYLWSAYQGLLRAESELGVVGTVYTSTGSADYEPSLQRCVNDGNQLCLSVSFLLGDATRNVALANPATSFAIVDQTWDSYPSNLRGMAFAEDEAGYLAGTLAGLMTQSNVVGAVGGMEENPAVVRFVEGYRHGAECANPAISVLVSYAGTFTDPGLGAQLAQVMISQTADVIFGPAGPTGAGAVLTATQSGVWGIGVDTDWYVNVFGNGTVPGSDRLLSSALKRVDNAVFQTIADVASGTFTPGTVFYHLADDGVGLAPFHETDPLVPQSVRNVLARVRQGIISGVINTYGPCPTLRFDPAGKTVYSCSAPFTMNLSVHDIFDLGGFQLRIHFNPQAVRAESMVLGTFLTASGRPFSPLGPQIDNNAGIATFGAFSYGPQPAPSGSGPIATITFSPVAVGTSDLVLQGVQFTDRQATAISVYAEDGSITVLPALAGDVDCDCDVDVVDIMLVASRWLAQQGDPNYEPRYDRDGDGDIDIVDIMLVASQWGNECSQAGGQRREQKEDRDTAQHAALPDSRMRLPAKRAQRDETFNVQIVAEGAEDLGGFEFTLHFDPRLLRVEGLTLGNFLGSTGRSVVDMKPRIDHSVGTVRFAAFSYGTAPGPYGQGTLATVTLRPLKEGSSELALSGLQCPDTAGRVQEHVTVFIREAQQP